jgi:hypothetical protein
MYAVNDKKQLILRDVKVKNSLFAINFCYGLFSAILIETMTELNL